MYVRTPLVMLRTIQKVLEKSQCHGGCRVVSLGLKWWRGIQYKLYNRQSSKNAGLSIEPQASKIEYPFLFLRR